MGKLILLIFAKSSRFLSRCGIGKFHFAKVAHGFLLYFLKSHLKPEFVVVQGHKIFLDSKDSSNLSIYGTYEPTETELLKREINKGDVVLDIGAHIGYYTLLAAKLVGEKGKVFAFEPAPDNFALLKKNVDINSYNNVVLIQKAVSNESARIKLFLTETSSVSYRIYDSMDERKSIIVDTITLDEFFEDYKGNINFIKMDIEGSEGKALQGMINLLKENGNIKVATEFYPSALRSSGITPEDYLKLLLQHGFKLYCINERERIIKPTDIARLMSWVASGGQITTLFCLRE